MLFEGSPDNFVKLFNDLREGYVNELDENEQEVGDAEWSLQDGFNRYAFDDFIIDDE